MAANDQTPTIAAAIQKAKVDGRLRLDDKGLTAVPSEVGQLTNLRRLYLSGNQLTTLPPWIGRLTNLQVASLSDNRLTTLPAEIGQLANLQTLFLSGNQLTELPPAIAQLTDLQILYIDGNPLTTLPPEVTQLPNLRTLALGRTQLTTLPPGIGRLTSLWTLYLNGNQLSTLPAEIGQLRNLQTLYLAGNQLTGLPPEITQLTRLQELHLAGNQLTALPPEVTQLTTLQTLVLRDNQLTDLPPEIGQLSHLRRLALDGNRLTALPRELAEPLRRGLQVTLAGNPLREPLPKLVERGPAALASYLDSLKDAIPQYEAKVLLVGEGNVGKTSLVAALRGDPFVTSRPSTHGIDIRPLTLAHPSRDAAMIVRMWDFGGQEVYRITHQFFFSPRALYLVVWYAREGQEQNQVEGWLRRIRLRVGHDAPTLVVATHSDERAPELDYPRLQQAFPGMLVGRHDVDNRSRNGIPTLRDAIASQAARLPQMGQLLSPRWAAARDEVLARANTEPQVSYEQFAAVCRGHQMGEEETTTLASLLHDLGQVIYYGEDEGLREIVVLNPEWLTKAISYVLEDTPTRQNGGVLDHARLREIWQVPRNGAVFPARHYPYFLRLMEKFDISYRLGDDDQKSLVAQLVPYERPNLPWDRHTPLPKGMRTLALECQLSEPAPGLVAWLTVRNHRSSTGRHWRSGVFLRYPIDAYNSEALLELRDDRHLAVEVRAPSPDLFFNVLRDSVEDLITRRWPALEYQIMVPCPTRRPDGTLCPNQFPLDDLLHYREQGGSTIPCMKCAVTHDISKLLTGFALPPAGLRPELKEFQQQLDDIASAVDRVERHAADTADSMRRLLKAVSTEVTDCPRLFTLSREQPEGMQRLRFGEEYYLLTLWCEQPDHWHPKPDAAYHLRQPKDWLVRIGPYATIVVKTLQAVVPIAGAVVGVALTDDQLKQTKQELELMKALVAELPTNLGPQHHELEPVEPHGQPTPSAGEALRSLRELLFEQDPAKSFGNLRRVLASSGDFLWVCPDHYGEYDPGLPSIPGSELRAQ